MSTLQIQFEQECPDFVSGFIDNAIRNVNFMADCLGKASADFLLDDVANYLCEREILRDYIVYRGGHHVAVCQGNQRLALITAA